MRAVVNFPGHSFKVGDSFVWRVSFDILKPFKHIMEAYRLVWASVLDVRGSEITTWITPMAEA